MFLKLTVQFFFTVGSSVLIVVLNQLF